MGEIFSQLAKDEMILNCSSPERSMKLIGSISKILMNLPSVVSMIPWVMLLIGIKSCTKSSFSGFLLRFSTFFLCFAAFSPFAELFRIIMMLAFRGSGDGLSVGIDDTAGVAEEGFDWRPLSRLENLALACERDGEYFYFSQPNWEKIPVSEKSCFSKKGVVVIGNGERFILDLHDNREYIKWDEAMAQYGNELPTKSQAEAMASNYKEINAADRKSVV